MSTALYSIVNNMAIQVRNLTSRVDELTAEDVANPASTPVPVAPQPPAASKEELETIKRQIGDMNLKITNQLKEMQIMETTLTHKLEQFALRLVKDRIDNMDLSKIAASLPAPPATKEIDVDAITVKATNAAIAAVAPAVTKAIDIALPTAVKTAVADAAAKIQSQLPPISTFPPVEAANANDVSTIIDKLSTASDDFEMTVAPAKKERKERTVRKKAVTVV